MRRRHPGFGHASWVSNRQSLYDTFGDKHALYLQALDRYSEVEGRKLFELLSGRLGKENPAGNCSKASLKRLSPTGVAAAFMGNANVRISWPLQRDCRQDMHQYSSCEEAFYRALLAWKEGGGTKGVSRFLARCAISLQQPPGFGPDGGRPPQDRKTLEDVVKVRSQ